MHGTRTLVLHPYLKRGDASLRSPEASLEEAKGLARAIDLIIAGGECVPLAAIRPATYLGVGKLEEFAAHVQADEIALVVVDGALTPVQQRNLEKLLQCKVIDRTALILEIFGARARTREGKLQVELAALNYQKSRLVRSWTHLERQRGGFGFLGGPGESQIEIDRRIIRDRIAKIRRELETVVRTRSLHRTVRREAPYPVVALVGYTNAGKSTLFNRLSGAAVRAEDLLFATLDPTLRAVDLPSGLRVMLSDTVGFVSDLPTMLVAAFRATLEEVLEADLLLHVRDISHPDSDAQRADVEEVLHALFETGEALPVPVLEVWNKFDAVPEDRREALMHEAVRLPDAVPVSALTGEGCEALLERVGGALAAHWQVTETFLLPLADGSARAWLHRHGKVREESIGEDGATLHVTVSLTPEDKARFVSRVLEAG